MAEEIKGMWIMMFNEGYNVRKSVKDGYEEWQPFKKAYENYKITGYEDGIKIRTGIRHFAAILGYDKKDDTHDNAQLTIRVHTPGVEPLIVGNKGPTHFFVQLFRIPEMFNYKLSYVKLAQLAYNAGQARAVIDHEKNVYDDRIEGLYTQYKLDKVETFVELPQ